MVSSPLSSLWLSATPMISTPIAPAMIDVMIVRGWFNNPSVPIIFSAGSLRPPSIRPARKKIVCE